LDQLVRFSLQLTGSSLSFVFERAPHDPNAAARRGQANCIGYAALFAAVFNRAAAQANLGSRYRSEHWVGKVSVAGQSLHDLSDSPFFRDHDYNRVVDLQTGAELAVDPSLYDYSDIVYVRMAR
jgi:hypothetical protein